LYEYSRRRKVTPKAVEDAILAGRIHRSATGDIDPEQADRDWEANTDPSKHPRQKRAYEIEKAAGAQRAKTADEYRQQQAEQFDIDKLGKLPYATARAIKENMTAKQAWIEVQKSLGELLDRREVADEIEKLYRVFRDAVLNIPNRVAAQVANVTEIADVQDVIAGEIHSALDELSATLQRIAEGSPQ